MPKRLAPAFSEEGLKSAEFEWLIGLGADGINRHGTGLQQSLVVIIHGSSKPEIITSD
jgi:hypothetical protein